MVCANHRQAWSKMIKNLKMQGIRCSSTGFGPFWKPWPASFSLATSIWSLYTARLHPVHGRKSLSVAVRSPPSHPGSHGGLRISCVNHSRAPLWVQHCVKTQDAFREVPCWHHIFDHLWNAANCRSAFGSTQAACQRRAPDLHEILRSCCANSMQRWPWGLQHWENASAVQPGLDRGHTQLIDQPAHGLQDAGSHSLLLRLLGLASQLATGPNIRDLL